MRAFAVCLLAYLGGVLLIVVTTPVMEYASDVISEFLGYETSPERMTGLSVGMVLGWAYERYIRHV